MPFLTRTHLGAAGAAITLAAAVALASTSRPALAAPGPLRSALDRVVPAANAAPSAADLAVAAARAEMVAVLDDSLLGLSGKLRARFVPSVDADRFGRMLAIAREAQADGVDVPRASELAVLPMLPFSAKVRGRVGPYVLGTWPHERAWRRGDVDAVPAGFIQVTQANRDLQVSEHFRLGDFVTKNQFGVWPKAMVLRETLVDKLELVIDELNAMGVRVTHVQVMSGFRTPAYNAQGLGSGRAEDSRHQYGDAADVFVDNDRDGRMDDLNGDGRVNIKDADVLVRAAERVEARNPSLVGGVGRYPATSSHGPFVHIDTRGHRARWG
jgi:hypothetical protein